MKLSAHFTLAELVVTSRPDTADLDDDGDTREAMPNTPDAQEIANLRALCERCLEPARTLLGVPLKVTSGFRSEALNTAIQGEPKSQHRLGMAADVVPVGYAGGVEAAMVVLVAALKARTWDADQLIVYPSGFLHISFVAHRPNRREVLRSAAQRGSRGPYSVWTGRR